MIDLKEEERLFSKTLEYKEKSSNSKLKLDVAFQRDVSEIDFRNHRTIEIQHLNPSDYKILDLNLDKVLDAVFSIIEPDYASSFSKDSLLCDIHMARLIEFIEKGNAIAPPILELAGKTVILRDGKHRMGLLRFLKSKTIPFLVNKNSAHNYSYLI